jgi:2-dehydro-3-deoxygluconokinase
MSEIFASIGECMVELSPVGDAGEGLYRRGFAGDTLNTAWYMRALAPERTTVRYVTAVGDDALSSEMLRFVGEAGIDTGAIRRIEGRTAGLYMITLDGAERSFTYWRDTSAARMLAADPKALQGALDGVTMAFFSGITLAILSEDHRRVLLDALERLKDGGAAVVFDPNVRLRLWPSHDELREALASGYRAATLALPTFPDEKDLFGDTSIDDAAARIAGYGVPEFVLKDGAGPSLVFAGGTVSMVPAIRVDRPVDTTGAGDSFNAGYLAGRLAGLSPVDAARRGHAVASRVIMARGALMPMSDLTDLRDEANGSG